MGFPQYSPTRNWMHQYSGGGQSGRQHVYLLAAPFQTTIAMPWDSASNWILGQGEQLVPCGQRLGWKLQRTQKKPEVYKDRTRYPQEVVSSLSSEVFKPRLLIPLGGWLEAECQHLWRDWTGWVNGPFPTSEACHYNDWELSDDFHEAITLGWNSLFQ